MPDAINRVPTMDWLFGLSDIAYDTTVFTDLNSTDAEKWMAGIDMDINFQDTVEGLQDATRRVAALQTHMQYPLTGSGS